LERHGSLYRLPQSPDSGIICLMTSRLRSLALRRKLTGPPRALRSQILT